MRIIITNDVVALENGPFFSIPFFHASFDWSRPSLKPVLIQGGLSWDSPVQGHSWPFGPRPAEQQQQTCEYAEAIGSIGAFCAGKQGGPESCWKRGNVDPIRKTNNKNPEPHKLWRCYNSARKITNIWACLTRTGSPRDSRIPKASWYKQFLFAFKKNVRILVSETINEQPKRTVLSPLGNGWKKKQTKKTSVEGFLGPLRLWKGEPRRDLATRLPN